MGGCAEAVIVVATALSFDHDDDDQGFPRQQQILLEFIVIVFWCLLQGAFQFASPVFHEALNLIPGTHF
jgi:hypothetical protein